jgi:hypothetical protein
MRLPCRLRNTMPLPLATRLVPPGRLLLTCSIRCRARAASAVSSDSLTSEEPPLCSALASLALRQQQRVRSRAALSGRCCARPGSLGRPGRRPRPPGPGAAGTGSSCLPALGIHPSLTSPRPGSRHAGAAPSGRWPSLYPASEAGVLSQARRKWASAQQSACCRQVLPHLVRGELGGPRQGQLEGLLRLRHWPGSFRRAPPGPARALR